MTIEAVLVEHRVLLAAAVLGSCYVVPLTAIIIVEVAKWLSKRLRTQLVLVFDDRAEARYLTNALAEHGVVLRNSHQNDIPDALP